MNSKSVKVAAVTPELLLANPPENVRKIVEEIRQCFEKGVSLAVFPELSIVGYTCGDLFYQDTLLDSCKDALLHAVEKTKKFNIVSVVGLPLIYEGRLYNCAAVFGHGKIYGIVPKSFLPNYNEFYEKRWFSSGIGLVNAYVTIDQFERIPFGVDVLFQTNDGWKLGIEICEDLWAVIPPSSSQSLNGANVIANLSASNDLVGKSKYRRDLVAQQSARCVVGYIYSSSGEGESSTDNVYSGHRLIADNGKILQETEDYYSDSSVIYADLDLTALQHDRFKNSSFTESASSHHVRISSITMSKGPNKAIKLTAPQRFPFVPSNTDDRIEVCNRILNIQAYGLARRLRHMNCARPVIGLSGGLDSTLALLVTILAVKKLSMSVSEIIPITMPGFGTSTRTFGNVQKLVKGLGLTLKEISIVDSVRQHFSDIGHDEEDHNVVYENAQARERTKILMDVANQNNGMVVGTGDLSEAALGWCTYNGDQMSMYHVNIGVPKTLVQYVIETCASMPTFFEISETLMDILDTPISPELLPLSESGEQSQATESSVGPYELCDFFLYHFCRYGRSPTEITDLATLAFESAYSSEEILSALYDFYNRFFSQQFKRSAMPDGPKIGSVALSPRGDWRMPSDAQQSLWIKELNIN